MDEKILIVGAGPTGLVLALWLTKLGVAVRIIDQDSGPGETSRALAVHARTLEFYQQLGFADEVVAQGIIIEQMNIRKQGQIAASIALGAIGKDVSPFPFVLSFPQDDHEKLLLAQLQKVGVAVERNSELVNFVQYDDRVVATIKKQETTETITTPYLLGCDGARSLVRKISGINFPGGTYTHTYYVADVMAQGDVVNGQIQLCLTDDGFSLVFPVRSSGSVRLIGIVPDEFSRKKNIEFTDIAPAVTRITQLSVAKLNWFSTYHSHHRVADHFKKDRVFLLGDAGHIHSPVGGQGMNTGIGDAINLAWKLAAVLKNQAAVALLDTYEPERIAFARRLVSTTDKIFLAVTNTGWLGKMVRNVFFPYVFARLARFNVVKHFLFNTVSQIKINYRHSALSRGSAGKIVGGDRLPWVHDAGIDNFDSLKKLDWQIHIYGVATAEFKNSKLLARLAWQEFPWSDAARKAGLMENAVYLIRPDGYVAFADPVQDISKIENYLRVLGI